MVCGLFSLRGGESDHPLLALLPPFVHIKANSGPARGWLDSTVQLLETEREEQRVGYESEEHLSRAFERQFGVAPGTYRKNSQPPSIADL